MLYFKCQVCGSFLSYPSVALRTRFLYISPDFFRKKNNLFLQKFGRSLFQMNLCLTVVC